MERNDVPDSKIWKDQEDSFWDFKEKPNKTPSDILIINCPFSSLYVKKRNILEYSSKNMQTIINPQNIVTQGYSPHFRAFLTLSF